MAWTNPPTFGDRLREWRIAAGLSQDELAERSGLSVRGISDLERGARRRPQRETVRMLAEALGLNAEELDASVVRKRGPRETSRQRQSAGCAPLTIPDPLTSFIGREREVEEVAALLGPGQVQLLTLTGPGGVGKTRLATAVARQMQARDSGDVVFVDLTPLIDSSLVLPTIATHLGVQEAGEFPLLDTLVATLRQRSLLLILDNVEHVVNAAAEVGWLVSACPLLVVLATSREPLRISGEVEHPVAPFALPTLDRRSELDTVLANPAVALFIQRARSATARFELTAENVDAIVAICQRVDGLPLAIEIAAAWTRLLSPHTLLERLQDPLRVLTGGARDLPDRQRTMRDTVQWSYGLLTHDEQCLFRRLSIFVGGWTLESAESVLGADSYLDIEVLDGMASLADKSLIVRSHQPGAEDRFSMLSIIREFAEDRLREAGEEDDMRLRLARRFDAIVLELEQMRGKTLSEVPVTERLWIERNNLRSSLQWCRDVSTRMPESAVLGLRIATHTLTYWNRIAPFGEGADWLQSFITLAPHAPVALLSRAYSRAGYLLQMQGRRHEAGVKLQRGLELADASGDPDAAAEARLHLVEWYWVNGQAVDGEKPLAEAIELATIASSPDLLTDGLLCQMRMAIGRRDYAAARVFQQRCCQAAADHGLTDKQKVATGELGWHALDHGDLDAAERYGYQAMALANKERAARWQGACFMLFARIALERGNIQDAREFAVRSLDALTNPRNDAVTLAALERCALIAAASGHPELAARTLAVIRNSQVRPIWPFTHLNDGHRAESLVRAAIGNDRIMRVHRDAQSMTIDDAVAAVIVAFSEVVPS